MTGSEARELGHREQVTSLTKSAVSIFLRKGFAFPGVHVSCGAVCTCPRGHAFIFASTPSCGSAHIPFIFRCCPPDISSISNDHDELFGLPVSYTGRQIAYSEGQSQPWLDYVT